MVNVQCLSGGLNGRMSPERFITVNINREGANNSEMILLLEKKSASISVYYVNQCKQTAYVYISTASLFEINLKNCKARHNSVRDESTSGRLSGKSLLKENCGS